MNETEFADEATTMLNQPAPPTPSYTEWVLPRGRQLRHRRRARRVGLTAAAAVVLAAVPTAVVRSDHASAPARLIAAASPPAPVLEHNTAGENSPYWLEQYVQVNYSVGADGQQVKDAEPVYDLWLGHSRPSVGSTGNGPDYPNPEKYPEFSKCGFAACTYHAWEDQWNLPADAATVRTYLQGVGSADAKTGIISSTTDSDLFEAGYKSLEFPGTSDFRRAIIDFMKQLPEVTTSTGTDDDGRAATLLTFKDLSFNQTTTTYVDLPSASLLETDLVTAPNPNAPRPAPAAATQASGILSRIAFIWQSSGPADSAPSGATTAEQQAAAVSIPANPDPSHPTCTPGKPVDATPLAAQMAAVCLPDPAPGFPKRRGLDYAGSKDDRSFYVAQASPGTATATIQMQPNNTFSLTGAKSITPDSDGSVGDWKAAGSTTVLGVPATELEPKPGVPGETGARGLIFSIDGLGVEVFADENTSFQTLITLADSMHIGPQPAG